MNQQKRTVTNEYWLKKLSGGLPNVSLPSYENVESATAAEGEGKKEKLEVPVPDTVSAQLKKIGKGSDTAVFILFMAALNTAIYKYTGIKDLTIGTVAPEKNRPDNQLLFCRIPVQGDLCFKEVANRTKKALLEAFNYREYSFDEFYTQLKNKYGRLIPDIFGTAFIYDKIQNKIDALDRFRMVLVLSETGGQMNLSAEFHPSCHRNIVLPFCQNLLYFLETGFTALDETLDNIDILSPPQKEVLHRLNETGTQYPDRKTIQELFEEQVAKNAREIAVVYEGEESTYGQLNIKANKLARVLTERGTKPDSIVGIMTERSLETIVGILGILKAGGAYLPIDPEFPESRVQKMLNDCRADILLTETDAIKDYSFTDLQGLRFKKASLHTTSRRPQIKDFNGVPCPDRSLVDYEKYHKFIGLATFKNMVTIQATRGCPYNCAYCHKIWPKSHVVRSAENIFAEVKRCYDVGIRRFALADDIFNLDEKNSRRFYQLIIDHGMKLQLFFPNGTRGDLLNESYIDLMMEAGTTSIALALESASPRLQKLIKKNLNLVKFRKNIEYICEKYPHVLLELFTM
ncbi:MAG: AMP-binding protein, partial [bacterium]|nr:AMP-binding protein [bacterium]